MSKKIFLSPSNQTPNTYAYGDTNEAVECGKMAQAAEKALKRCGFQVKTMQWESMQVRCKESDKWGADLHIPIHTNAFDTKVAGTRTMVYKKSGEAYEAAQDIHNELAPITPGKSENITAHPELYELKAPKAPSVYLEVDFHDNKEAAKWLVENTEAIGEAICKGVCKHFGVKYVAPDAEPEKPADPKAPGTEAPAHYDTAKAGTYKVNAEAGLWLRMGASTNHQALKLMDEGTVVKCLGHYTGVWLRVETQESIVGFCHSDFLTKS
jgi:N-acetylmuramoyl-L-alanine amidase